MIAIQFILLLTVAQANDGIDLNKPVECHVQRFVSAPYFRNYKPEVGSVAIIRNDDGEFRLLTLQDLLNDEFVYFKDTMGRVNKKEYLWRYGGKARRVDESSNIQFMKFLAGSVVGDIIISISDNRPNGGVIDVTYKSKTNGLMFSMDCLYK